MKARTTEEKDALLAHYGNHLFAQGHTAAEYSKVRAAAIYMWPGLTRSGSMLPRARRTLVGFTKLALGSSSMPVPYPMLAARVNEMLVIGAAWEMAACLVVMFATYARPRDALRLRRCQLHPPVAGAGAAHCYWNIVLHLSEHQEVSKTGDMDENLVMDNEKYAYMPYVLFRLRAPKREGKRKVLPPRTACPPLDHRAAASGLHRHRREAPLPDPPRRLQSRGGLARQDAEGGAAGGRALGPCCVTRKAGVSTTCSAASATTSSCTRWSARRIWARSSEGKCVPLSRERTTWAHSHRGLLRIGSVGLGVASTQVPHRDSTVRMGLMGPPALHAWAQQRSFYLTRFPRSALHASKGY